MCVCRFGFFSEARSCLLQVSTFFNEFNQENCLNRFRKSTNCSLFCIEISGQREIVRNFIGNYTESKVKEKKQEAKQDSRRRNNNQQRSTQRRRKTKSIFAHTFFCLLILHPQTAAVKIERNISWSCAVLPSFNS